MKKPESPRLQQDCVNQAFIASRHEQHGCRAVSTGQSNSRLTWRRGTCLFRRRAEPSTPSSCLCTQCIGGNIRVSCGYRRVSLPRSVKPTSSDAPATIASSFVTSLKAPSSNSLSDSPLREPVSVGQDQLAVRTRSRANHINACAAGQYAEGVSLWNRTHCVDQRPELAGRPHLCEMRRVDARVFPPADAVCARRQSQRVPLLVMTGCLDSPATPSTTPLVPLGSSSEGIPSTNHQSCPAPISFGAFPSAKCWSRQTHSG